MRLTPLLVPVLMLAACASPPPTVATPAALRKAAEAEIELVESAPLETTLDHAEIANASAVWPAMFDRARTSIDIAEFYASEPDDGAESILSPSITALERAAARKVAVRFLADAKFAKQYPKTLEALAKAGVDVRRFDVEAHTGGVLHAKYFVVDRAEAYVGSQNFDWRSLEHIQEMGVRVRSNDLAIQLDEIFTRDWRTAGNEHAGVDFHLLADITAKSGEKLALVGSPTHWMPDEDEWELPRLVKLLDGAARTIDLQVLVYKPSNRDGSPFTVLDDAMRRAAGRGVHVRLLVSDWSTKPGNVDAIAQVPNVEVRVLSVPKWSGGEVAFARVAHAKFLIVDGAKAWVGSSNWEGDYFTKSRNVGVIAEGGKLPPQLDGVFEGDWTSAYVKVFSARPSEAGAR